MGNIYFELTEEFNRDQPTAALASGQAVVYYRVAIMSKDGDWVIRETPDACERVLGELEGRGARYRLGAPLDVRWLAGGWSSHFEFADERRRRIRCDFLSRPPRVEQAALDALLARREQAARLLAIDVESLILEECRASSILELPLREAHARLCEVADRLLPREVLEDAADADAQ